METDDEKERWRIFEQKLDQIEDVGLTIVHATGPFTAANKAKIEATRARILRALWGTIVAIHSNVKTSRPATEAELKTAAQELLKTLPH
jgi:hypothetical protein